MAKKKFMQNREISWLRFNERVLEEAADPTVPLLEQLKFISIFTSNLDEFFMIRVGSLHTLASLKKTVVDNKSGWTAEEQITHIMEMLPAMMAKRDALDFQVKEALKEKGIYRLSFEELSKEQKSYARKFFQEKIEESLSPQIVDISHPFPFLENNRLVAVFSLERDGVDNVGFLPISDTYPKYVVFPGEEFSYILTEDLIQGFGDRVFPGFTVLSRHLISVTRNYDLADDVESQDEFEDFKAYMKAALKKRKRQEPVRLESKGDLPKDLLDFLLDKLDLPPDHYFAGTCPLRGDYVFSVIGEIPSSVSAPLLYPPFHGCPPKEGRSMVDWIQRGDRLLVYPFHRMDAFLNLLKEASENPDCVSIKITIYRLAKNSKIVKYLSRAAEAGVEVTVFMELKARFDEERNIQYSNVLYEAGCNIIYGFPTYKTHSKVCLITFRDKNLNYSYISQFGTGNYNESTATQYTDFSLLTADKSLGLDAVDFFKNLAIGNVAGRYGHLLQAPVTLKEGFLTLMDREIAKGEDGYIFAKFNSLTDLDFIEKIQEASDAGVEVKMVVRGICCLLPGIPGVTENVEVHSVVGRFLEHTRLYIFGKGEDRKMYLSSADLMTRNMERRVEVAVPVYDEALKKRLTAYSKKVFADTAKGRRLSQKGLYERIPLKEGEVPFSSQDAFIEMAMEQTANMEPQEVPEKPKEGIFAKILSLFRK